MGPFGKSLGAMGKMGKMAEADESEGPMEDMDMEEPEDTSGVPPEFQSAYDEYTESPTAETMYAMIEACKAGGESKPGGLALILGGKGKK